MKKTSVAKAWVVILSVALAAGCAGMAKGPTDQELVQMKVQAFKDALLAKDVDKIMACVSESFYHPEAGDKAAAKDLVKQGIDSGFTEGGEVDLSKAQTKIEKDVATVYPITASASAGSVTVGLTLKKEKTKDGVAWNITEINVEGI